MSWSDLTDTEHTGRADDPTPMRAVPKSGPPSPVAFFIALLILAALAPAYVKLLVIIAQWSWDLLG